MSAPQKLCLRWNNHCTNLLDTLNSLLSSQLHSDVTLACQGEVWHLHRLVLSAASSHFAGLLSEVSPGQSPMIIVDGPTAQDIAALIRFIYHGEVSVDQDHLQELLKTATALKIKGLAEFPVEEASCLSTSVTSVPHFVTGYHDQVPKPSAAPLPLKKTATSEYISEEPISDVPLNLSFKRARHGDPPKDYSFKKRIIQEECPDYGRKSNIITTNILHEKISNSFHGKMEEKTFIPSNFNKSGYSSPAESKPQVADVDGGTLYASQPSKVLPLTTKVVDENEVLKAKAASELDKNTANVQEMKLIKEAQSKNYKFATANTIINSPELKYTDKSVPPIKRFKSLENYSNLTNDVLPSLSSPQYTNISTSQSIKITSSINPVSKSSEIRNHVNTLPQKVSQVKTSPINHHQEFKFVSVKQENLNYPNTSYPTSTSLPRTVIIQKSPHVKEELMYVERPQPIKEYHGDVKSPILSSAFLSKNSTIPTSIHVTGSPLIKITSSQHVMASTFTPQQPPQPSTLSTPEASTPSMSSVTSSSVNQEEKTTSSSNSHGTTTVTDGSPVGSLSSTDLPISSSNSQRVSVNMRTFKEEWRRQLLVDYDPRSNMSICMLCFTTFKSYDGPRKNTYVKHAKRFHPALDEYSEEDRDLIINNYEKQYKYDVDMQKEVNKTFRCGGSSVASANRSGKIGRSHSISTTGAPIISSSCGSSTASGSLPGSRPDTDGEEDHNLPAKSRSGSPDSEHGGETREKFRLTPNVSPTFSTLTPHSVSTSQWKPMHSPSSSSITSISPSQTHDQRSNSIDSNAKQDQPNNNNNNNLTSLKSDPKSRSKSSLSMISLGSEPERNHYHSPQSKNSEKTESKISVTVAAVV